MPKYNVYLTAFAGASYTVEADSEQEAIEMAWEEADDADIEFADWDHEGEPDVNLVDADDI